MRRVVCPGSYDPVTNGHLDIVRRVSPLFDEVLVTVVVNPNKRGLFTVDERLELLAEVTADLPNIRVDSFSGLLVDYCRDGGIGAIAKGIRTVGDFEYEEQMAQMNRALTGVETLLLPGNPQFGFVSSSLVREVARLGGDVTGMLPESVRTRLLRRLGDS